MRWPVREGPRTPASGPYDDLMVET